MAEDDMVGWHHQLNGHEFEQILGDCEGQGSLACYSPSIALTQLSCSYRTPLNTPLHH